MSTDTPPLAATTDDRAVAIRRYRNGDRPEVIADDLETDLETITAALRRRADLRPWDDHRALGHLFDRYGSITQLAEALEGARSAEVLRTRMDKLGVERGLTSTQRLEKLNPEDVGLSPLSEDEFPSPDDGEGQQTLADFGVEATDEPSADTDPAPVEPEPDPTPPEDVTLAALLAAAETAECPVAELTQPTYRGFAATAPGVPPAETVVRQFGSWSEATEVADRERDATIDRIRETAQDALETVAKRVDGPLSARAYDRERDDDHPPAATISVRFGWNAFKDEIGLETVDPNGGESQ